MYPKKIEDTQIILGFDKIKRIIGQNIEKESIKNIISSLDIKINSITESNLGINPQVDGQILRIHIPQLTEERRKELTKILKNLGEKGKVSIRNIRRESNDNIKKLLKEKKISEDESKDYESQVQKNTDDKISTIEKILTEKEKEILTL